MAAARAGQSRRDRNHGDRGDHVRGEGLEGALVVGGGILVALMLRFVLFPIESGDFTTFTRGWFESIGIDGPIAFLAKGTTNYAPAYTYAMIAVHFLFGWLPPVVALKLISLPFDFVCAWYVAQTVGLRWTSPALWRLAFVLVLVLPTMVVNSAAWGQADVLYATGVVAFVYYAALGRGTAACVALGLAFAIKLQALFIAPLLVLLMLSRRISWRMALLVPGLYLASILPAWLAGRPIAELLTVYWRQAGFYPRLTSNAPHVYQWLPNSLYESVLPAAILWGLAVVGLFVYAVYRARPAWDATRVVQVAATCLILVPFCLPKMHERYFFPADIMAVVLAFYFPRLAFVPVLVGVISFLSYTPFLMRTVIVPIPLLAFGMGAVLLALLYHLGASLAAERVRAK